MNVKFPILCKWLLLPLSVYCLTGFNLGRLSLFVDSEQALISFGNENIVFKVKGKNISLDSLRNVEEYGLYNIEGQDKTSKFPFKRHLYYWAAIYAYSLNRSQDYKELCPVISIVIYRERRQSKVIRSGYLDGDIFLDSPSEEADENKRQLKLYAVSAAKWKMAESDWLKYFLAVVYLGIMEDIEFYKAKGINADSNVFQQVLRSVRIACSQHVIKISKNDEKGQKVVQLMTRYISEETERAAEARGETRGEARGEMRGKVLALHQIVKMLPQEIASNLKISEDTVLDIISSTE